MNICIIITFLSHSYLQNWLCQCEFDIQASFDKSSFQRMYTLMAKSYLKLEQIKTPICMQITFNCTVCNYSAQQYLTLTDLKPFTIYTIGVRCKPQSDGFWSIYSNIHVTTLAAGNRNYCRLTV